MPSVGCQALVVSGYLGVGKTTLVRHLLAAAQRDGVRAAVVSNEFGELGIDRALLARPGEAYVEIEGGCVCCRLSDELVATLQMLHERVAPQRVIVETSGVALPFDTQMNFWRDPVSSWIEDDVAGVVVDAEQLGSGRDLDATWEQQVSSAELLVVNKVDLVPPGALPGLEGRLREIQPDAPLVRTVQCRVDPDLLFPPDPRGARRTRRDRAAEAKPHTHDQFETRVLAVEAGVDPGVLVERLRSQGALRAKGFVSTAEGLRLVQGVGERLELSDVASPPPDELVGQVVLILRAAG